MELPRLQALWEKYRGRGLSIIAVEANRDSERAQAFIAEHDLSFHLLENEEDNDVVYGLFESPGFPSSYLVDSEGRIVHAHVDFEDGDERVLEQQIASLLGS